MANVCDSFRALRGDDCDIREPRYRRHKPESGDGNQDDGDSLSHLGDCVRGLRRFADSENFGTLAALFCFERLGDGVFVALLLQGSQLADVSKVAPVDKLSVVFTIFLAFLLLGEQPSPKVIVGGLLILAGSFTIIL